MNLREQFEKLHPTPDGVYWRGTQGCFCYDEGCHDIPEYLEYVSKWQGFQAGHAAGLEQQAKRIAELEASLADSNEALQVMGLKLAHAESIAATKARDYEHEKQIINNIWALLGNPSYESLKGRTIYDLIAEKHMQGFQDGYITGLDDALEETSQHEYAGEIAIAIAALKDQSHSANTVGPTPVMDAAPACEQLADNEDAVYAVAYKLCLQDGADEDSAHTLIWEGHPPEPWGEVWMRYEFQARELLKALDERRALMANHQATFQSGHECMSRVSNSDSQMNKQDDTRTAGESDS